MSGDKNDKYEAFKEVKGVQAEEALSRVQRKEEQEIASGNPEKQEDTKWLKMVGIGGVVALMAATVIGLTAVGNSSKDAKPVDTFNINTVLEDEEYEAWMILNEPEFVVIGDDIDTQDMVKLTSIVELYEGEAVTGYYFDKEAAAEAFQGNLTDFHTDNLKIKALSDGEGSVDILSYVTFPQIEADATAIADWTLDAEKSTLGDGYTFHIPGTLAAGAPEKDIIAQLKGLSNMTDLYNQDPEYSWKQFEMKSGAKQYVYHTKSENVLAQKTQFNTSQEGGQEEVEETVESAE